MGIRSQRWFGGQIQCHEDIVQFTRAVEGIIVAVAHQREFVERETQGEKRLRALEIGTDGIDPAGIFRAALSGIVARRLGGGTGHMSAPCDVLDGRWGRFSTLLVIKPGHTLAGHGKGLFVGIGLALDVLGQLRKDIDAIVAEIEGEDQDV